MKLEFTDEELKLLRVAVEAYGQREDLARSAASDETGSKADSRDVAIWKDLVDRLQATRDDENLREIWKEYAEARSLPSNPAPTEC